MILKAFSLYLQEKKNKGRSPEKVLIEWLSAILLFPPEPNEQISQIIHKEIAMAEHYGCRYFEGRSDTGRQLLQSLSHYCRSYDHWQFSRWIHEVQASDFNRKCGS